jgi:hypothetical protein
MSEPLRYTGVLLYRDEIRLKGTALSGSMNCKSEELT